MHNKDEVSEMVRGAVIETFSLKEAITDDNISFKDDLNADSIDMVSLMLLLEEQFSDEIVIDDEEAERFETINDVIDFIVDAVTLQSV